MSNWNLCITFVTYKKNLHFCDKTYFRTLFFMEDNTSEIRDRIKTVMNKVGKNSITFSEEIGIQQSTLSHILNGRNRPSLDVIMKIHERYPEVRFDWLINGEGNMYSDQSDVENEQELMMNHSSTPFSEGAAISSSGTRTYMGTASQSPTPSSPSSPFVVGASKMRAGMSDLFNQGSAPSMSPNPVPPNPIAQPAPQQGVSMFPPKEVIKYVEKPAKRITEIIIYYDDNTWEKFTCEQPK